MNKWWLFGFSLPAVAGLGWIGITSAVGANTPPPAHLLRPSPEIAVAPLAPAPDDPATGSAEVRDHEPAARRAAPGAESGDPPARAIDPASQPDPDRMKALQELLDRNPEAALAAARDDLARYPKSPDAAEQTWVVVKALTMTGRFEEAHREGSAMLEEFRGTPWAGDVERHVLAHPP